MSFLPSTQTISAYSPPYLFFSRVQHHHHTPSLTTTQITLFHLQNFTTCWCNSRKDPSIIIEVIIHHQCRLLIADITLPPPWVCLHTFSLFYLMFVDQFENHKTSLYFFCLFFFTTEHQEVSKLLIYIKLPFVLIKNNPMLYQYYKSAPSIIFY